jgi:hypothetical protein
LALLRRPQLAELPIQQRHDRALGVQVVVPDERRWWRARVPTDRHLLRGVPGAGPLLFEQLGEPVRVHGEPRLGGELLRELQGEPEGVRELERVVPSHTTLFGPSLRLLEQHQPLAERRGEPVLLRPRDLPDERLVLPELGIGVTERGDDRRDHRVEHRPLDPQAPSVRDRAPQHPPQDVSTSLVRGLHTVGDQERGGASVLGDDLQRHVVAVVLPVGASGERLGDLQHRPEQIRLEDVLDTLQDHRHAFE